MATVSPILIISTVAIGLILALAFQLLLTSLGVAAGLSAAPFLVARSSDSKQGKSNLGLVGVGLGLLTTLNLVLFAACFLTIKLNLIGDSLSGAIVGLVIWAVYWLLLIWLSSRTVGSLLGTIAGFLTGGVQQLSATLQPLWRSQQTWQPQQTGQPQQTVDRQLEDLQQQMAALRQELTAQTSSDRILPPSKAKGDVSDTVLDGVQAQLIRSVQQAVMQQTDPNAVVEKLLQPLNQWVVTPATQEPTASRKGAAKQSPNRRRPPISSSKPIHQTDVWQRFGDYLRDTSHSLKQKQVKQYLKSLAAEANQSAIVSFDRKAVKSWLTERSDLRKKQIKTLTDRLEKAWNDLEWLPTEGLETATEPNSSGAGSRFQAVRHTLSNLELPGIENDRLKQNLHQILATSQDKLRDLKAAIEAGHLQEMKPEALIALLPSTEDLSELTQPLQERVTTLREDLLEQLENLQQQATQRIGEVKQQAQQQTASTAKTVAIAAWWLVGVALTSALTSALAGAIAIH